MAAEVGKTSRACQDKLSGIITSILFSRNEVSYSIGAHNVSVAAMH